MHWRIQGGVLPAQAPHPQRDPILLLLHMFLPKSAHIRGQCPPPMAQHPPQEEILDPPLMYMSMNAPTCISV